MIPFPKQTQDRFLIAVTVANAALSLVRHDWSEAVAWVVATVAWYLAGIEGDSRRELVAHVKRTYDLLPRPPKGTP